MRLATAAAMEELDRLPRPPEPDSCSVILMGSPAVGAGAGAGTGVGAGAWSRQTQHGGELDWTLCGSHPMHLAHVSRMACRQIPLQIAIHEAGKLCWDQQPKSLKSYACLEAV